MRIRLVMLGCAVFAALVMVSAVSAEMRYEVARKMVMDLPCVKGGTVDQFLNAKAEPKAVDDLGWKVYPRDYGYEVERLMLVGGTMLSYKWSVDKNTLKIKALNGKAIDLTPNLR